jgi:DNA-binding NarL/FixJ family response regulator
VPAKAESLSVFVVDDHAAVREGLRSILEGSGRYCSAFAVSSAEEAHAALAEIATESMPVIALVDINLKGQSGIDFVRDLSRSSPALTCVIISVSLRFDSIVESFAAGAKGYITKDQDAPSMLRVLDAVSRGEIGIEGEALSALIDNSLRLASARSSLELSRYDALTPREKEVFRLVALNSDNKEIAKSLRLSVKTIENVKSAIFGKLAVQDRFELYRYALRIGVIEEA